MSDKPKFLDYVNVYEFDCKLPGSKEVIKFKPVTTGQIKQLLTYENETNYVIQEQALDDLISSSVLSDGFNVDDLYLHDRMFLLLEIRKKTKGEVLEFQLTCPECESQSINRVNLDELNLVRLGDESNVVVELDKIKVHLRHMKRGHQKADMKKHHFPNGMTNVQRAYIFQVLFHACAIEKIETPNNVDENIPMKDRIYFIENIPMGHMEILQEAIDKMAFGWEMEHTVKCTHCGYNRVEPIPMAQSFFG